MDEQQVPLAPQPEEEASPRPPPFLDRHGIPPVLFAFLVLIVAFILYQMIGGVIAYLLFQGGPTSGNVQAFRVVTGLSQLVFLLLPALMMARLATHSPRQFLRIRRADVRAFIVSIVGIFSLQQLLQIYLVFQGKIPIPEKVQSLLDPYKKLIEEAYKLIASSSSLPELMFVIVVIALVPAFAEEILFRGLVQRSFERGIGPAAGVLITGLIFGLYHLNPFSVVPLIALGIYLGFLAMRANSLWVSIAAHFFNNASACVAVYLHQSDDAIITGNPDEMPLEMLAGTLGLFMVLFVLSTLFFIQFTRQSERE